jgi:murein DD-endopeptidase MepM/ murein hydrolase activator NlpD
MRRSGRRNGWSSRFLPVLGLAGALAACAVSAPAPVIYRGAAAPPVPAQRPATAVSPNGVHLVGRGESLTAIASRYGVPVRELIDRNRLSPPYELVIGQALVVPQARLHVVQAGDTLHGIARAYRVDLHSLVQANGLAPPYPLTVGQRLRLPAAETAVADAGPRGSIPYPRIKPGAGQQIAAAVAATPAAPPPPARAGGRFAWPVKGRIVSRYGAKPGGLHNDGINIAAARGAPVRAAENGVVVYAGNELKGFGNLVLIRHADGWVSAYAHVDALLVAHGATVRRGQLIARVGSSGSVSAPQLHFELRRGSRTVDPLGYLESEVETALSPAAGPLGGGRPGPG